MQWWGHEIDLTSGHRYQKYEIYKLYVSMILWNTEGLKPIGYLQGDH